MFWFRTEENKSLQDVFSQRLGGQPSPAIFFFLIFVSFYDSLSASSFCCLSLSLSPNEWFCVLRCKGLGTSSRNFIRHSTDWLPLEKPAVFLFFFLLFSLLPPPLPPHPPSLYSFLFLLMFGWVLFVRLPLLKAALNRAVLASCGRVSVCMFWVLWYRLLLPGCSPKGIFKFCGHIAWCSHWYGMIRDRKGLVHLYALQGNEITAGWHHLNSVAQCNYHLWESFNTQRKRLLRETKPGPYSR